MVTEGALLNELKESSSEIDGKINIVIILFLVIMIMGEIGCCSLNSVRLNIFYITLQIATSSRQAQKVYFFMVLSMVYNYIDISYLCKNINKSSNSLTNVCR